MAKAKAEDKKVTPKAEGGRQHRTVLTGTVVSDKMDKTVVVKTTRRVKHKMYKKYVNVSKKFKVHDEKNEAKSGDLVAIVSSRPLSKDKRWALQKVIRTGSRVGELKV